MQEMLEMQVSIPGTGRSPGGGHGNPLQNPCLGNPMDRGTLRATVSAVPESDMTEVTEHTYTGVMTSTYLCGEHSATLCVSYTRLS